jgi:prepilin-type N-terminal cleavage/methylation domain-containing protein
MKRFKFTLIELLVVIAIIGILASILLPVLGKARKKPQAAVCKSNQKQLGVAFTMYLDDNESALPHPTQTPPITFDDLLSDYDGRSGLSQTEKELSGINETTNAGLGSALYECPSDRVDRNANIVGNYLRSYSISANINGSNAWAGIYGVNVGTSREFSEINSPSSVLTFVELICSTIAWGMIGPVTRVQSLFIIRQF